MTTGQEQIHDYDSSSRSSKAKKKASEVKDTVEEKLGTIGEEASGLGHEAAAKSKEKVSELRSEAEYKAKNKASEQKEQITSGLHAISDALRRGTDSLPEEQRQYGSVVNTVADKIDDASSYLEDRDVEELTFEARRFAREHASIFIGGAVLAGFAGARFLKSSGDQARQSTMPVPSSYRRTPETSSGYEGVREAMLAEDMRDEAGSRYETEPDLPYTPEPSSLESPSHIQEEDRYV